VNRAKLMTVEILAKMRELLGPDANLVTWRTVWRAHFEFVLMLRYDDVKRLKRENFIFEEDETGPYIRVKLIGKERNDIENCLLDNSNTVFYLGGKTVMYQRKKSNEKLITYNPESDGCLYKLTQRYCDFLGAHSGSMQPTCRAGFPNRPHPDRVVGYDLALSDLREVYNSI